MEQGEWTPVTTSIVGAIVNTPQGTGTIRRISTTNDSAQVDIEGQLFEVPLSDLRDVTITDTPSAQSVEPKTLKVGDRVQTKDGNEHGVVTRISQRIVEVEWDDGTTDGYEKKIAHEFLDYEQTDSENKTESEQVEDKTETKDTIATTGDGLSDIFKLKEYMEKSIDSQIKGELSEIRDIAKSNQKLEVKVGDKTNLIEGLKHKQLEQLITYAQLRLSPLLVGMAGTGKTHAAEQTARALDLPFFSMSVGAQTSKSDIIGYMAANGQYVSTHFRAAYEFGGLFLMDEIDAGNANVLIQINAALSNGLCAFPDAMVKRHDDFVFIASANTFGNGASRQYVGRNQLDAATLDRFALVEWLIDDDLEESLAHGLNGKAWYMAVRVARDYVADKHIRALITPRATQKGSTLLDVGIDVNEVINATMLGSVPEDNKADLTDVAIKVFEKFASTVPSALGTQVNPEVSELLREGAPF